MNRRTWIIIGIVAVAAIVIYRSTIGPYNEMVKLNQDVKSQWAQVENVYQRRADLIPNLVSTVKGYADFEKGTLTAVIEARASATQVKVNVDDLSPESIQKFQQAQGALSSALGKLLVVSEQYPNLKANQNFLELQAQLEGTENRISVERNKFNDASQTFNTYILSFPNNLVAGMFGFKEKTYFTADEGANKAPVVKF